MPLYIPPGERNVGGEAANEAAMLALSVFAPGECIRTDFSPPHIFYLSANPASDTNNWHDLGSLSAGAGDPATQIGLAAVNGAASSFMRSDAAPALNQGIAPTWTGAHKWTQGIDVQGGVSVAVTTAVASPTNSGILLSPAPNIADVLFFDSGLTANNRTAEWIFFQGKLQARFKNDAGNAAVTPLAFAGGQGAGITGIESTSGSGAWAHTGDMNVDSGALGIASVVNFTPSGIGWLGNNVPWEQFGGGTGLPGDVWTSTGNATSPGWSTHFPQKVGGSSATAQSANVNTPNFYAVAVGGMYRVSTFIVITRAATTSATMPSVNVGYTEASTGANVQDIVSLSSVANTVGSHSGGTAVIQCQQGSNISYSTSNYASSGATSMQYRVDVLVERLS